MKKRYYIIFSLLIFFIVCYSSYSHINKLNHKVKCIYIDAYCSFIRDLKLIDEMEMSGFDSIDISEIRKVNMSLIRVYTNGRVLAKFYSTTYISFTPEEMSFVLLKIEREYEQENEISENNYLKYKKIREYLHKILIAMDNDTFIDYKKVKLKDIQRLSNIIGDIKIEIHSFLQ